MCAPTQSAPRPELPQRTRRLPLAVRITGHIPRYDGARDQRAPKGGERDDDSQRGSLEGAARPPRGTSRGANESAHAACRSPVPSIKGCRARDRVAYNRPTGRPRSCREGGYAPHFRAHRRPRGAAVSSRGPRPPRRAPASPRLQVALRAQGHYPAAVDGVDGPLTRRGLTRFQQTKGIRATGTVGRATRTALGPLGKPLLGQRELGVGAVGWDVSSLEFRLDPVRARPGGRRRPFTAATAMALARFQAARGLAADGIAGKLTFGALAGRHERRAAFDAAGADARRRRRRELLLDRRALPRQPAPAREGERPEAVDHHRPRPAADASRGRRPGGERGGDAARRRPRDAVRASIDHWSAVYGVDPQLARATAWMESGFQQSVVSNVGAVGVMQLLPEHVDVGRPGPARHDDAADLRRQRPRRRALSPLAARPVRRRQPPRPRGLLPGRPGRPRPRPLRRHEALRDDHPEAVRHGLSGGSAARQRVAAQLVRARLVRGRLVRRLVRRAARSEGGPFERQRPGRRSARTTARERVPEKVQLRVDLTSAQAFVLSTRSVFGAISAPSRPFERSSCTLRCSPVTRSRRTLGHVRFSPNLHPFLVQELWRLDDGHVPIAELWRVDHPRFAWEIGLASPGYHTVRVVVRAERRRRAAQREALLIALEESFQWAPSLFRITDHLAAAFRLRAPPSPMVDRSDRARRGGW